MNCTYSNSLGSTLTYIDQFCSLGWSFPQLQANIFVPKISALLSCCGDIYVIRDVLRNPTKRKCVYRRIVMGMSCIDFLSSFFLWFLGTWPTPRNYNLYAVGNLTTCDIQGFISSYGLIGVPLYNCSLSTYYLLFLRQNWRICQLKKIQKWFHIIPWTVGSIFAVAGLILNTFSAQYSFCWIGREYPIGCSESSTIDCERGGKKYYRYLYFPIIMIWITCILFVATTMFMTFRKMRIIERASLQYGFPGRARTIDTTRSDMVLTQGLYYSLAMIFVWLFPIALMIVSITGGHSFVFSIFMNALTPLQGFFNCLIYLRPHSVNSFRRDRNCFDEFILKVFACIRNVENFAGSLSGSITRRFSGNQNRNANDLMREENGNLEHSINPNGALKNGALAFSEISRVDVDTFGSVRGFQIKDENLETPKEKTETPEEHIAEIPEEKAETLHENKSDDLSPNVEIISTASSPRQHDQEEEEEEEEEEEQAVKKLVEDVDQKDL